MTRSGVQFVYDGPMPRDQWTALRNRLTQFLEEQEEIIAPALLARCVAPPEHVEPAMRLSQLRAMLTTLLRAGWLTLHRESTIAGGRASTIRLSGAEAEAAMAMPEFWMSRAGPEQFYFCCTAPLGGAEP